MMPSILIVDDEKSIRESLKGLLTDEDFEVLLAPNGYEALKVIEKKQPDLVLLDIWLPGMDGIETLKTIKQSHPNLPIVMITGHGTIETAVSAVKAGAFDFLEKPLSIDKVIFTIKNALNFKKIEEENLYLRKKMIEKNAIDGVSDVVDKLRKEVFKIAMTDFSILIYGESGTGKELIARTIHQLSPRAEKPLITVNCSSLSDDFVAKEFLGCEKGVLGVQKSKGLFEVTDGGTLFFDEVADMSFKTQGILLNFLEKQKFKRMGSDIELNVNVRIIAATNKNLSDEVKNGKFREDLFFRLNVIPICVPALRERKDDIPILIEKFLNEEAKDKKMTKAALEKLSNHSWLGNTRELKNFIKRLLIFTKNKNITIRDIDKIL